MICSSAIVEAVQCALAEGNEVAEISEGWANVKQVVHMRSPLTRAARERILSLKLRHWLVEPTPHNKAEEGFTDESEKVAVTFPQ